ncbi:class I SAM-dependent methyltransferase [Fulvivirga sp. M361]|uniref:class I SAM-dependent methyltransferase n=1 Tax=Fulvivirga sp. M361 TaxID=2594266 RepID=UPI00117A8CB2|nr:class I SAM-dependent methyltransferase [Fulvivirga sp. M361]TRX50892.1 class I SAM-dependent methyltransferase [Fulvivirga sp. M361]
MPQRKEWFGEWFDSPYYHVLYKERDNKEAEQFINKLVEVLHFSEEDKILDVACGKGRHSIHLNQKGFDVVGIDLSEQNIEFARQYENEHLHFYEHDMREVFAREGFDVILNLFTSFGYFEAKEENEVAIKAIAASLKKGGTFLLDFLNPYTVIHNLKLSEEKVMHGITFKISKKLEEDFIIKDIHFFDQGVPHYFQERVRAIRRIEFLDYFHRAGLKVKGIYGNYSFEPYEAETSDRMIFIVDK